MTSRAMFVLLVAVPLAACAADRVTYPTEMEMTTWSVVGVDAKTGDVGVAVASCVPSYGDAVAALVPGKGAAATQAGFDIKNRNKVFEAIKQGLTAEAVIAQVTDPTWDSQTPTADSTGVLTMHNGFVRAAGFTDADAAGDDPWRRRRRPLRRRDGGPQPRRERSGQHAGQPRGGPAAARCLPLGRSGRLQQAVRPAHARHRSGIHRRRRRPLQPGQRPPDHLHGGHPRRARRGSAVHDREHRHDGRRHRQGAVAQPVGARRSRRGESAAGSAPPVPTKWRRTQPK